MNIVLNLSWSSSICSDHSLLRRYFILPINVSTDLSGPKPTQISSRGFISDDLKIEFYLKYSEFLYNKEIYFRPLIRLGLR